MNNDGKLDVAVANAGSNDVSVLLGTGTGTLAAAVNYRVGRMPFSPAAVDLNRDGFLDLVVANTNLGGSASISILINRGNGTFFNFSANSARRAWPCW